VVIFGVGADPEPLDDIVFDYAQAAPLGPMRMEKMSGFSWTFLK
jgi:hypothetical protein